MLCVRGPHGRRLRGSTKATFTTETSEARTIVQFNDTYKLPIANRNLASKVFTLYKLRFASSRSIAKPRDADVIHVGARPSCITCFFEQSGIVFNVMQSSK
jgi:hypothetical protein